MLASVDFHTSDRNKRFLAYVVEETLANRGDRIKAYNIATSVFGRGANFDPQSDTIVRIEAGRLRRALEHFYLTCPDHGHVRIAIPTGTYVPSFALSDDSSLLEDRLAPPKSGSADRWRGPRVLVADFEQEGEHERFPGLGRRFSETLIRGLTLFDGIFVYGVQTSQRLSTDADASSVHRGLEVDFMLSGTITVTPEWFEVEVLLQRMRDARYVWASKIRRPLAAEKLVAVREEVASAVARILAQRYGIICSHSRDNADQPPADFDHYMAVVAFYDYWRDFDPRLFQTVLFQLEKAVYEDPQYAEALSCLSLIYTNAVRYGYDVSSTTADPIGRATQLADEAIRLAPASSRAFYARGLARWFNNDPSGGMEALKVATALNPDDDEILGDLGLRHAVRMEWDEALSLVERSYARNPYQSGTYRVALFLFHFAHGRYEEALREARLIGAPMVAYSHLAIAAAEAELGNFDAALTALDALDTIKPGYLRQMESDLALRNVHPDIVAALRMSVEKAIAFVPGAAATVTPIAIPSVRPRRGG